MAGPPQSPDPTITESVWDYTRNHKKLKQTKSLVSSGLGWHFYGILQFYSHSLLVRLQAKSPGYLEQPAKTVAACGNCCFRGHTQRLNSFYLFTALCMQMINKKIALHLKASQLLILKTFLEYYFQHHKFKIEPLYLVYYLG